MNRKRSVDILSAASVNLRENPFVPHPLLRNGHFQSVVGSQQRRQFPWGWKHCHEEILELEDGSEVKSKFLVDDGRRPTLIVIHGMSGSSESGYMLALSHKAYVQGWNFVLPSLYNVEAAPDRPKIFHAGCSDRIAEIIDICTLRHGLEVIVLAGISMGGNILLKLLGEWGSDPPAAVRAAATISPLVDLMRSWKILDKPSNSLYRWHYLRRLRQLSMLRPEFTSHFMDLESLAKVRTILGFDELVTAPLSGFSNAFDYYRKVSAVSLLLRISLPTLIIHSKDDPLLPWEPLAGSEVAGNDSLLISLTGAGGHVAFIAKEQKNDIDRSWAENRLIDFLSLGV